MDGDGGEPGDRASAASRRGVSEAGLAFIKAHEGFRGRAAALGDGRWLLGYSSVQEDAEGQEIAPEQAEARLKRDLEPFEDALEALVFAPLSQGQVDALVSLGFSIGLDAFRACGVAEALNDGRPIDAAAVFDEWRLARMNGATKTVDALVRRRAAEKAMFLALPDGPVGASSVLLRPTAERGLHRNGPVAPDPALIARINKILPEPPSAPAVPTESPPRGEGEPVPASEPEPEPASAAAMSVAPAPAPAPRTAAPAPGAAPVWGEVWPWLAGGVGLALLAVGVAELQGGQPPGGASAELAWSLAAFAGAMAAATAGYSALRRVVGIEDEPPHA